MILTTEQFVELSNTSGCHGLHRVTQPQGMLRLFIEPERSMPDVQIYVQPNFESMVNPEVRREVFRYQRACILEGTSFVEVPFYATFNKIAQIVDNIMRGRPLPRPVSVTKIFKLAYGHRLNNPLMSDDENCIVYGACNRSHGHNMQLEVTVHGWANPATGMVINFNELKRIVNEAVVDKLDHQWLNDVYGEDVLTTCEVTTPLIMGSLADVLPIVQKVRVFETDSSFCEMAR